jgi:hypothetical protein
LVSAEVTTYRLDDYAQAVGAEEIVPGYDAADRVGRRAREPEGLFADGLAQDSNAEYRTPT